MSTENTNVAEASQRRMHVALDTRDVAAATRFYEAFFDRPPAKTKPRYAKFTLEDPPLALALIETGAASDNGRGGLNHLGVQVDSTADVQAAIERLTRAGLAEKVEREVDCCYARQDKVWARDPDGNRWEIYTVLGEAETLVSTEATTAGAVNTGAVNTGDSGTKAADCADPAHCCAS